MKITWIGQAGLILKSQGKTVIVDPYLSDSVKKVNPNNCRRVPVDTNLFGIKPDIIILTHNHMDHTDEETLRHYITQDSRVTVLASGEAWKTVRKFGGAENNYVLFNCGTRWTDGSLRFCAVHAEHSDCCAIGVIVCELHTRGNKYRTEYQNTPLENGVISSFYKNCIAKKYGQSSSSSPQNCVFLCRSRC